MPREVNIEMEFSKVVKEVLANRGIKNSDLAKMTSYSPQYISDLLSGERRWNETSINRVCAALEMTINFEVKTCQDGGGADNDGDTDKTIAL